MAEELKFTASATGFNQVEAGLKGVNKELVNTSSAAQKVDSSLGKTGVSFTTLSKKSTTATTVIKNGLSSIVGPSALMTSGVLAASGAILGLGAAWLKLVAADFIGGNEKIAQAHKKAAEAAKEYQKEFDNIVGTISKEASRVAELVSVLNSESETRTRKLGAIKELNKIAPEIFSNLTLEKNAVIGLDTAYQNYIDNLKNVIAAKLIQAKIESKITDLLNAQGIAATEQQRKSGEAFKSAFDKQINKLNEAKIAAGGFAGQLQRTFSEKQQDNINRINLELSDLFKELKNLSEGIKIKPVKDPKEEVKNIRTVADVLKDLKDEQEFISKSNLLINTEMAQANIAALKAALDELIGKFKLGVNEPVVVDLAFQINKEQAQLATDDLLARTKLFTVERTKSKVPIPINVPVKPKFILDKEAAEAAIEAYNEKLSTLMKDATAQAFVGLGETIGNIISEGGGFDDIFKGIFKTLGAGLKQLGVFVIAQSQLLVAIKAALTKAPALAIPLGIALVALGTAISNAVTKKTPTGFAVGTGDFGGGLALVGERGPELVTLPRHSAITPAAQTSNILNGGMAIQVYGRIVAQGSELVTIIDRATAMNRRNN